MVLKKTITDNELMEVAVKNINENFQDLPVSYTIAMGLFITAVAAEIFSDGEEVLSNDEKAYRYIVGNYKYNVSACDNVGNKYNLIIEKDNNMVIRKTNLTEAQALKYIILHAASHQREQ